MMGFRKLSLLVSVLLMFYMVVPAVQAAEESGAEQQAEGTSEEAISESEDHEESSSAGLSADSFEDLTDVPEDVRGKIDALIRAGVFNGLTETEFGLHELMNRAQLAKVIALIFSLPIDEALTTSSFSDVTDEFAYAVPYIEALKEAGLTKGSDPEGTLFNPGGEVTRQELAAFLIRGLGLEEEAKATAPVEDETVGDWARTYVALALEKGIMSNLEDGTFGGTVPATREMLAVAAFDARPEEAKASIVEAEVIGAKLIAVKLNRSVDVEADLEVWSGATSLNRTVEWDDDSKSAVITMDKKLTKGKYKIKLVGLEEDAVEVGEIVFEADNETLASIDIVSPSTTLPQGKVTLEYKMKNQYGEETDGFHVKVMGSYPNNSVPVLTPGKQTLQIDLKNVTKGTPVPVVLMNELSGVSANQVFTVGDPQVVKTIELGELKIKGKDTVLKPGGTAYLTLTLLDQYGFRVRDLETVRRDIMKLVTGEALKSDPQANPFIDYDNDGYPELQLDAVPNLNSNKESTVKLISVASGETVTQTVSVAVPRLPASIEFAYLDETLSDGDTNKYVEMIVKDANGDKLTADEVVNAETTGKLMIISTGPITLGANPAVRTDVTVTPYVNRNVAVQDRGKEKGKIRIASITGFGPASINVYIMTGGSEPVRATFDLHIQPKTTDQRPSSIVVDGGETSIAVLNTTPAKMKFDILDQYNKDFKNALHDIKVEMKLERISGDAGAVVTTRAVALSEDTPTVIKEIKDIADRDIEFVPDRTKTGSYRLTATLVKINPEDQTVVQRLSSASIVADVIDGVNPPLVYEFDVEEDTLYAIGKYTYDRGITTTVTDATYQFSWYNDFGASIEIRAKDVDGRKVVLPSKMITNVLSSNPSAVAVNGALDRIIGLDAGTSKLTVLFNSPNGSHMLSKDVTVKYDPLEVGELKAKKQDNKVDSAVLNGLYPWDAKVMDQITIVHNFGEVNSGKSNGVDRFLYYNRLFNGVFVINNLKFAPGTAAGTQDRIYVGPDYKIVYVPTSGNPSDNNLIGFTISFVLPNGKTVTTDVEVQ
ncbi:S-layer homology domain-containing protein [Paenibacillus sp.]|uniref:S-layer homology domain-containing protein n=1 Tax=Paenibacillus sp. TaxID=58172 RepID=UPI002D414851|nr:S-layer homology domain-containing protein [Paenibacillus sp.]HZG85881.1 S-layer homology domain-containing protein [Paenibacillus sp.]